MRHVEYAMSLGAEEFRAGPFEKQASGATDAYGESEQPLADAASRFLIGDGREQHESAAHDVKPD